MVHIENFLKIALHSKNDTESCSSIHQKIVSIFIIYKNSTFIYAPIQ